MQLIKELEKNPNPTDDFLKELIESIRTKHTRNIKIAARLASIYAKSGSILSLSNQVSIDVASTGGPSSLSTLIIPLFFSCAQLVVPKLGVPGRPAGGIDCLAQIPNYKYSLDEKEVYDVLQECNYAHFLANDFFAPLDKRVFGLRKQCHALGVPTLVVASLLSKKIAAGINIAGLDIRVAKHGNFGNTWEEARRNAIFFGKVSKHLGFKPMTVLTDARFPFQPFIGRKESLFALWKIFEEDTYDWIHCHLNLCKRIAIACAPIEYKNIIYSTSLSEIQGAFKKNIEAQGACYKHFCEFIKGIQEKHVNIIRAERDGFISYSLDAIRDIIVAEQMNHVGVFSDPLGMKLLKQPGEWVEQGMPMLLFRCDTDNINVIKNKLSNCITIDECKIQSSDIEGIQHG